MQSAAQAGGMGRAPLCARLVSLAEEFYDIPPGAIRDARRRNGNISKARFAVSYVLVEDVGWSLHRVGKELFKDHKAIHNGCRQAESLIRTCPIFFEAVRRLREEVSPHDNSSL